MPSSQLPMASSLEGLAETRDGPRASKHDAEVFGLPIYHARQAGALARQAGALDVDPAGESMTDKDREREIRCDIIPTYWQHLRASHRE
eukprot:815064-Pyramimonas_sp.AAC.1